MSIPIMELDDTWEFTLTCSVAPDSSPGFAIFTASGTVISSFVSVQSDSTHYSAIFTASAPGPHVAKWLAEKTISSSVRQFRSSYPFRVASAEVYS